MTALIVVCSAVIGLAVGSFLNVVIWRVPRGESVVSPPSHCPGCEAPIRPVDNVPVLSWLLLRGRCRHCRERISVRYPAVELLTAVLFVELAKVYLANKIKHILTDRLMTVVNYITGTALIIFGLVLIYNHYFANARTI